MAEKLLELLPDELFDGVVYLDHLDRKMVFDKSRRSVLLQRTNYSTQRLFTFYDQVHTTGMDIKQHPTAMAFLTIGKDMTFRDYAQVWCY